MLLGQDNPYRPQLPEVLSLAWEDFEFELSAANEQAIGRQAEWAVLSYMAADCDLAALMYDDLLEMKAVGSDPSVHVCALFDGPLLTDAFFARLNEGTTLGKDLVLRWRELRTNEKATLTMALQVAAAYPGDRRALFLGGHGNGWKGLLLDRNMGLDYQRTPGRLLLPGTGEACDARMTACQRAAQDRINQRIEGVAKPARARYDVMALDACYMGNVEAIAGLVEFADVLVVSEDLMPGEGYPYGRVLGELRANPRQSAIEFARYLVGATQTYYLSPGKGGRQITQVALATQFFADFASAFVRLVQALGTAVEADIVFDAIHDALTTAWKFAATGNIDLIGFVQKLLAHPLPEPIAQSCAEVLDAWTRMVIAAAVPGAPDKPNGVSIYAPAPDDFDVTYIELSNGFAHHLGIWSLLLASYYLRVLGTEAPGHPLLRALRGAMEEQIRSGAYHPRSRGAAP